jgi:hypothetical protein
MLVHPLWAPVRDYQERHDRPIIAGEAEDSVRLLQEECRVPKEAIRFASGGPTVFAIATSGHMLLNPYPYSEEAHGVSRCWSARPAGRATSTGSTSAATSSGPGSGRRGSTSRRACPTRPLVEAAPVRVSKEQEVENELLRAEIQCRPPRVGLTLLEFSTHSVGPVIRLLQKASAAARSRLGECLTPGSITTRAGRVAKVRSIQY